MHVYLYIKAINTDKTDYDYKNDITNDELIRMQNEKFNATNDKLNAYINGEKVSKLTNDELFDNYSDLKVQEHTLIIPMEAYVFNGVFDGNIEEMTDDLLKYYSDTEKMSIVSVDINPLEIIEDAESELRFWIGDSEKIINDDAIDQNGKIGVLPERSLKLQKFGNKEFFLMDGCKIIDVRKKENHPYRFIMLVKKITKQ